MIEDLEVGNLFIERVNTAVGERWEAARERLPMGRYLPQSPLVGDILDKVLRKVTGGRVTLETVPILPRTDKDAAYNEGLRVLKARKKKTGLDYPKDFSPGSISQVVGVGSKSLMCRACQASRPLYRQATKPSGASGKDRRRPVR